MRDKIIKIRTSIVEEENLKNKALSCGMTVSRYMRELALGHKVKVKTDKRFSQEEKEIFLTLAGIANNLSQVAKKYNQGERVHTELLRVLQLVEQSIKNIMNDRDN